MWSVQGAECSMLKMKAKCRAEDQGQPGRPRQPKFQRFIVLEEAWKERRIGGRARPLWRRLRNPGEPILGRARRGKSLGPDLVRPRPDPARNRPLPAKKSAHPSPITTFCWDLGLGLVDLHTARKNLQGDSIDVPVAHEWSSSQRQTSPEPVDSLPSINTLSKFW